MGRHPVKPRRRALAFDAEATPLPARRPAKEYPHEVPILPDPSDPAWGRRVRAYLGQRYGWTCHWCGARLVEAGGAEPSKGRHPATVEHLVPKHAGGTDELSNLRLAGEVCNISREPGPDGRPRYSCTQGWPANNSRARRAERRAALRIAP